MVSTQGGGIAVGDEVIDTSSLVMGIVNAVVMNAKARGEGPEAAVNYLRAEVLKKIKENPPLMLVWEDNAPETGGTSSKPIKAQSLYVSCPSWNPFTAQDFNCWRWTNSIPYVLNGEYNNLSSDPVLAQVMEEAMQDWTTRTGGRVTFHHADQSEWFRAKLFGKGVIDIGRDDERSNAEIGYGLGLRKVRILKDLLAEVRIEKGVLTVTDKGLHDNPRALDKLRADARHELGHVIGLLHEHQRWDRDAYVDVSESEDYQKATDKRRHWDYRKVDMDSSIGMHLPGLEPQTVIFHYFACRGSLFNLTCGWREGSFTVWVPVWKYQEKKERTGRGSDGFDFSSIMLYDDLLVRPSVLRNCPSCAEGGRTKLNTKISDQDAATAVGLVGYSPPPPKKDPPDRDSFCQGCRDCIEP